MKNAADDWWSEESYTFRKRVSKRTGILALIGLGIIALENWIPGAALIGLSFQCGAMLTGLTLAW